ncbi:MAG: hypothetical protein LC798_20250 [Chloroflexi bacterium]|nr:hypothetical protein [Chloroflexota bacterium]
MRANFSAIRMFTIDTYQHVLPGMQAEASRIFEQLISPAASTGPGKDRLKTVEALARNSLTRAYS